ncbi:MAG: hypothetical protein AABY41_00155 [Nitrospirota bacterium]
MKKLILLIVAMLYALIVAGTGNAQLGGLVFYKYGTANLKDDIGR